MLVCSIENIPSQYNHIIPEREGKIEIEWDIRDGERDGERERVGEREIRRERMAF